jgi:hypothetical protein
MHSTQNRKPNRLKFAQSIDLFKWTLVWMEAIESQGTARAADEASRALGFTVTLCNLRTMLGEVRGMEKEDRAKRRADIVSQRLKYDGLWPRSDTAA